MQLIPGGLTTARSTTLSAGIASDVLPGTTSGFLSSLTYGGDPPNMYAIRITETGGANAVDTISIYRAVASGGTFVADSTTYSIIASGSIELVLTNFVGDLRIKCTSTSGATVAVDIAPYFASNPGPQQTISNGVAQGIALGGTISGALSQSSGTFALSGNGASTITTSSGAVTITSAAALNLGTATSTSVVIGATAVAPSFPGGLTVAANKAVTGSGAFAVEATGALSLGVNASSTSIAIGQATVVANFVGGITIASSKTIVGLGAMSVDAASGSTLSVGTASNALTIGQSAKVTTINGLVSLGSTLAMGSAAHASALVTLASTTQGFLPPRGTTTNRDAIGTPAEGLIFYNTSTHKLNLYTTGWEAVTSA
jgi:hypothetical protein